MNILKAATVATMVSETEVNWTPEERVQRFTQGLVFKLCNKDHLMEIKKCGKDVQAALPHVVNAVDDFKKKDLGDILKGIGEIGQLLVGFDKDFTDCTGMSDDWHRIQQWSAIFKDPKGLGDKVMDAFLHKYDAVMPDINDIITESESDHPLILGRKVGNLLVDVLGTIPMSEEEPVVVENPVKFSKADILQFLNGLVTDMTKQNHFNAMQACLKDAVTLAGHLENAIGDFKKKDILKGVVEVGNILSAADKDFHDCTAMKADWTRIQAWAKVEFKDPKKLEQ